MTEQEADYLADVIKGYWPTWRKNVQQVELLMVMFGNYPLAEIIDAFRDHRITDPEEPRGRRPRFKDVQQSMARRYHESLGIAEEWNWGNESELAYRQEQYDLRGQARPADDYIIRQEMGREPPSGRKRAMVQQAMEKHLRGVGQPVTVPEIRAKQREHAAVRTRGRKESSGGAMPADRREPSVGPPADDVAGAGSGGSGCAARGPHQPASGPLENVGSPGF